MKGGSNNRSIYIIIVYVFVYVCSKNENLVEIGENRFIVDWKAWNKSEEIIVDVEFGGRRVDRR